jgi:hypothetical protein
MTAERRPSATPCFVNDPVRRHGHDAQRPPPHPQVHGRTPAMDARQIGSLDLHRRQAAFADHNVEALNDDTSIANRGKDSPLRPPATLSLRIPSDDDRGRPALRQPDDTAGGPPPPRPRPRRPPRIER